MKSLATRTAAAALALAASLSCMKKPDLTIDDGPTVSVAEVQRAVISAWGDADASDLIVQDFVAADVVVKISDYPSFVNLQDSKTVNSVEDHPTDPNLKIYKILRRAVEDPLGQQKPSSDEFPLEARKAPLSESKAVKTAASTPYQLFSEEWAVLMIQLCTIEGASCHRLRTWDETVAAPSAVASRPHCEGTPNCMLRKHAISFDLIFTDTDPSTGAERRSKDTYTIKITKDAPYLARVTDFCVDSIGSAGNSKYPQKVCYLVKDFRRGDSPQ